MGTDAEVFIFDYEAYRAVVVPAFVEVFRGGPVPEWLRPFVGRREVEAELWDKRELARFADALNPDFSWRGPYDLQSIDDRGWRQRWSMANVAAARDEAPPDDLAEQVNWLFEISVSIKCLEERQFVGRSYTVSHYAKTIAKLGVKEDARTVALFAALGKRGFIIGYQFGFGFEGINGWLDPAETAELAERLSVLPLPRYEDSFEAMERFRKPIGEPPVSGYEYPGFTFEELSLSFVRTTASIAAAQNRGLLWGNGVMPASYYSERYFDR